MCVGAGGGGGARQGSNLPLAPQPYAIEKILWAIIILVFVARLATRKVTFKIMLRGISGI